MMVIFGPSLYDRTANWEPSVHLPMGKGWVLAATFRWVMMITTCVNVQKSDLDLLQLRF